MKKVIPLVLCLVFVLSLVGCGKTDTLKVEIDYGTSSIYTEEDMNAAIDKIMKEFNKMEGCELHSLSYSSDDVCNDADNIAWMNDLEKANDAKETFSQCIMFNSSFRAIPHRKKCHIPPSVI